MHKEEYYEMISFYLKCNFVDRVFSNGLGAPVKLVPSTRTIELCAPERHALRALFRSWLKLTDRSLSTLPRSFSLNVRGTRYSRMCYRG